MKNIMHKRILWVSTLAAALALPIGCKGSSSQQNVNPSKKPTSTEPSGRSSDQQRVRGTEQQSPSGTSRTTGGTSGTSGSSSGGMQNSSGTSSGFGGSSGGSNNP